MRKYITIIRLILVLAVSLSLINCSKTFKETHTSETEAIITSVGTGCGSSHTVVKFKYNVNGAPLESWTCYNSLGFRESGLAVNKKAIACYDPSDPEDSSVIPIGYRC